MVERVEAASWPIDNTVVCNIRVAFPCPNIIYWGRSGGRPIDWRMVRHGGDGGAYCLEGVIVDIIRTAAAIRMRRENLNRQIRVGCRGERLSPDASRRKSKAAPADVRNVKRTGDLIHIADRTIQIRVARCPRDKERSGAILHDIRKEPRNRANVIDARDRFRAIRLSQCPLRQGRGIRCRHLIHHLHTQGPAHVLEPGEGVGYGIRTPSGARTHGWRRTQRYRPGRSRHP